LYPFAPHISEELNEILGGTQSLQLAKWPEYDSTKAVTATTVQVIVQVNGKMKDKLQVVPGLAAADIKKQALESEKVQNALQGRKTSRVVIVPNRLVNIVIEK